VTQLVDNARFATGKRAARLPVALAMAPVKAVVNGILPREENAIILADQFVHISFANDCLVIARGAVEISHASRCVVLAGHHADVGHDGNLPSLPWGPTRGSLVVCGDSLRMGHATDSVCCAPKVRIAHAHRATFLNVGERHNSHDWFPTEFEVPILRPRRPARHPLADRLELVRVEYAGSGSGVAHFRLLAGGGECRGEKGAGLVDGPGKAVPGLAGWTVCYCGPDYALLNKGRELAGLRVVARASGAPAGKNALAPGAPP
jgi:hypothetical protein